MRWIACGEDSEGECAGLPECAHYDDPAEGFAVSECLVDVDEESGTEEESENHCSWDGGTVAPLIVGIGDWDAVSHFCGWFDAVAE